MKQDPAPRWRGRNPRSGDDALPAKKLVRVVGRSGVVMDLSDSLAHGLIRNGSVRRVGDAAAAVAGPPPAPDPAAPEGGMVESPSAEASTTYGCDQCSAVAKSPAGLAAHKRSHVRADPEPGREMRRFRAGQ